jgi:hypothetical protein
VILITPPWVYVESAGKLCDVSRISQIDLRVFSVSLIGL